MVFGLFGKKKHKRAHKPKPRPKKAPKHKPINRVKMKVKHAKPARIKPKVMAKPVRKTVVPTPKTAARPPKMPAGPERMDDIKAFEILKNARLPVAPYFVVKSDRDLPEALKKVGVPCVMKISGSKFAHRSEVGGVAKDVNTQNAESVFKTLMKIKGAEKIFAQKQMSGVELIIGAKSEPQFGYIVSIGLGGIYKDILRDIAFRVMPLDLIQAQTMVRELKGFDVLTQNQVKLDALYELLMRIGKFVADNKFKEVVLNPVFCNAEGCWIASAKIVK